MQDVPTNKDTTVDPIKILLAEGLDLCVRARKLDEDDEAKVMRDSFHLLPEHPAMKCGTPWLWTRDQYDKDLADWEARARKALSDG